MQRFEVVKLMFSISMPICIGPSLIQQLHRSWKYFVQDSITTDHIPLMSKGAVILMGGEEIDGNVDFSMLYLLKLSSVFCFLLGDN